FQIGNTQSGRPCVASPSVSQRGSSSALSQASVGFPLQQQAPRVVLARVLCRPLPALAIRHHCAAGNPPAAPPAKRLLAPTGLLPAGMAEPEYRGPARCRPARG